MIQALQKRILSLQQANLEFTTNNSLIKAFEISDCQLLDELFEEDQFIRQKRSQVLDLLKEYEVGHHNRLKPAFDAYQEAMNYLFLKEKVTVECIREQKNAKTPDFKIFSGQEQAFLEMKTLGYVGGELGYLEDIESGLEACISIEEQLDAGREWGIAMTSTHSWGAKGDPLSMKHCIEVIVSKIEQNLKEEQFSYGTTFLFIDLKLLSNPFTYSTSCLPIYYDKQYSSLVSGVLWNTAFGKVGNPIFKPIEHRGAKNIEGELRTNGVLISKPWIKALCFRVYWLGSNSLVVGFHRWQDTPTVRILQSFCNLINDEENCQGWKIEDLIYTEVQR